MRRYISLFTLLVALGAWAPAVRATFHLWKIDEIYSNASGVVQYIELINTEDGETKLNGQTLSSGGHSFTFPADLPDATPTAGHRMLLATPGYSALKGVTPADFSLGINNFFSTAGDTLTFAGGLDTVTFSAANLPTDGLNSINRSAPGAALVSAVNSATNLAGTSGEIPPWENQDDRFDVNGQDGLSPIDAVQVINNLIAHGIHILPAPAPGPAPPPFLDVTGDNSVSPQDAIQVINALIASPQIVVADPQFASQPQLTLFASPMVGVPEPSGGLLALLGAGLLTTLGWARNRRREAGTFQMRDQAL